MADRKLCPWLLASNHDESCERCRGRQAALSEVLAKMDELRDVQPSRAPYWLPATQQLGRLREWLTEQV